MKINEHTLTQRGMRRASSWARATAQAIEYTAAQVKRGELTPEQSARALEESLNDFWEFVQFALGSPPDPTPAEIGEQLADMIKDAQDPCNEREDTMNLIKAIEDYAEELKKL